MVAHRCRLVAGVFAQRRKLAPRNLGLDVIRSEQLEIGFHSTLINAKNHINCVLKLDSFSNLRDSRFLGYHGSVSQLGLSLHPVAPQGPRRTVTVCKAKNASCRRARPSPARSRLRDGRKCGPSEECIPRLLRPLERRRPRHPHPEQGGIREAEVRWLLDVRCGPYGKRIGWQDLARCKETRYVPRNGLSI
jgi:hypothetical protein